MLILQISVCVSSDSEVSGLNWGSVFSSGGWLNRILIVD